MFWFWFCVACMVAHVWLIVHALDLLDKRVSILPIIIDIHINNQLSQKEDYHDRRRNIEVKPLQVKFSFTTLNRSFIRVTWGRSQFFQRCYTVGYILTLVSLPFTVGILVNTLWSSFVPQAKGESVALQAVIPGVNLPFSQLLFYVMSIVLASVFHEIGHALAASAAGIPIESCGLLIFVVIPVAFVELNTESYSRSDPKVKLQVVCAGIWHNYILAAICFMLISSQGIICESSGVTVVSSAKGSLERGDIIQSVNDCPVHDRVSWVACLSSTSNSPITGFCLTKEVVKAVAFKSDPNSCCHDDHVNRGICFSSDQKTRHCLPVRQVVKSSLRNCSLDSDCPQTSRCFKPNESSDSRLFIVKRLDREDYFFYGHAWQLLRETTVLGCAVNSGVYIIYFLDQSCRFLMSFSLALGVLNVIPCFFLDGHHIMLSFMEATEPLHGLRKNQVDKIVKVMSFLGSLLLAACVFIATSNQIK